MRGHFFLQGLILVIVLIVFALAATGCKDAHHPAYAGNISCGGTLCADEVKPTQRCYHTHCGVG